MAEVPVTHVKISSRRPARRGRAGRKLEGLWAAAFLTPALLSLIVLRIAPTVGAVSSSLYKGFPGGIIPATFAGLHNYEFLFSDPQFKATIFRTILFNVVINPLQIGLALAVSVLLVQNIPLVGLWRGLMFVPITIPIVGSCIAWGAALNPQGPVNAFISAVGGSEQPFFTSPDQALASIIMLASGSVSDIGCCS